MSFYLEMSKNITQQRYIYIYIYIFTMILLLLTMNYQQIYIEISKRKSTK